MQVNTNILQFDVLRDLNIILVHHYLASEIYRQECNTGNGNLKITLRQLENKTNLSIRQIRRAIQKLEEAKIIEVVRGNGKNPSIYKYLKNK